MKRIFQYGVLIAMVAGPILTFSQKLEPTEKDALLKVSVINEKEKPEPGEKVIFQNLNDKKEYSGVTGADGTFDILVPKGSHYNIRYKTLSSEADYTKMEVPDNKNERLSIEVVIQFEKPRRYTLDNVYFETGKADIRPSSFRFIDEVAEYMRLKKDLVIEISGHTDNVGTPESNLKLSQDRADAVRNYLIKKGVASGRVTAKGYGDTQPVSSNDSESGRQQNRRTEVRILKD